MAFPITRSDDTTATNENFKIVHTVDPGTYYLRVTAYFNYTGSYVVQATLGADTTGTAIPLALGTPYTAVMHFSDDVHYFRIVVAQSGKLTAWTTGNTDTVGEFYNGSGGFIDQNDSDGPGDNFRIVQYVKPGTYYLKVKEYEGETGSYVVQATLEPRPDAGDTRETATLLALGTPYREAIHLSDDVDYFQIVVAQKR